jgi:hypothetical protein
LSYCSRLDGEEVEEGRRRRSAQVINRREKVGCSHGNMNEWRFYKNGARNPD